MHPRRTLGALACLVVLACGGRAATAPAPQDPRPTAAEQPALPEGVEARTAAKDPRMRYFVIRHAARRTPADTAGAENAEKKATKKPQHRRKAGKRPLLLVLPGGDGGADFRPFVERIARHAVPDGWLVAQLVAPKWDVRQRIVWPTERLPVRGMRFSTEEFVDAVVADLARHEQIDRKRIYLLGWSSGGPPVYAAAVRRKTPVAGAFVAMSVFKPEHMADLRHARGKRFFVLHSPEDFIPLRFAEAARDRLREAGATTRLETYRGGHGWRGDVYGTIAKGLAWLAGEPPAETRRR